MPTIDFGKAIQDAKGASFEALPIGDYDVEVAKSEAVVSTNGKPMVKVTMRVLSGPYEKRPIINNFVLSLENAQATAIFFRHMKAFGLTEDWFASLGQVQSLEPVASALLNRRARLSVGHREWQGEMRNEVKGVKPYTGAPGAPLPGPSGPTGGLPGHLNVPGPVAPPVAPPAPQPAPVAPPAPAAVIPPTPVADAPPVPQVQSVPQPPAHVEVQGVPAVPTSPTSAASEVSAGYAVEPSSITSPTPATSETTGPTPPPLPF
jgi:hypothetical protein